MAPVATGRVQSESCEDSKAEREAAGCATRASLAEEPIKHKPVLQREYCKKDNRKEKAVQRSRSKRQRSQPNPETIACGAQAKETKRRIPQFRCTCAQDPEQADV